MNKEALPTDGAWAFVPRFRVIRVGDDRRGIRLEEIYWTILKDMASSGGVSVGDVIEGCEARLQPGGNLSSALRVEAARHLQQELGAARLRTGVQAVHNQVMASPSPSFALSDDKRLIAHNPTFMAYVRSRLSRLPQTSTVQGVRLSLDVPFADLVEKLKIPGGGVATVGFVVGVDEQLIRGRLNAVLAPLVDKDAIIGFILPG
ncbi:ribbon-helix-helix domain-containing protein [Nitratireductor sp. ZSWI3]|uniref:ribbon-helix-helix domain-containing protein n=1 Tax=Nitratireductor sp. ZSWI3 TaxID=2966359 RepID=UPI0021500F28|nr:ribbon-helix-helix domain-containing protein [Nitratireductor sp. ZSWI3]MCR4268619.1 ribbon-helix-helix domain-containing protein [Nitratireductor sp. ZSWI3]